MQTPTPPEKYFPTVSIPDTPRRGFFTRPRWIIHHRSWWTRRWSHRAAGKYFRIMNSKYILVAGRYLHISHVSSVHVHVREKQSTSSPSARVMVQLTATRTRLWPLLVISAVTFCYDNSCGKPRWSVEVQTELQHVGLAEQSAAVISFETDDNQPSNLPCHGVEVAFSPDCQRFPPVASHSAYSAEWAHTKPLGLGAWWREGKMTKSFLITRQKPTKKMKQWLSAILRWMQFFSSDSHSGRGSALVHFSIEWRLVWGLPTTHSLRVHYLMDDAGSIQKKRAEKNDFSAYIGKSDWHLFKWIMLPMQKANTTV